MTRFSAPGLLGEAFATIYALLYWPFVVGTLVVTAWLDRAMFRLARNAMLISGAVGLAVMATYPVAPPRLLNGYTDPLRRTVVLRSIAGAAGVRAARRANAPPLRPPGRGLVTGRRSAPTNRRRGRDDDCPDGTTDHQTGPQRSLSR
jgi:hypothetical protein